MLRRETRFADALVEESSMLDFGHPSVLISGLIISLIGTALFIYGKKSAEFRPMFAGLALAAVPMFVTSLLVLWLTTGAVLGGLYVLHKFE